MEEKGYGYENMCIKIFDAYDWSEIPKQMLIGYMLEYIRDHKIYEMSLYDDLTKVIDETVTRKEIDQRLNKLHRNKNIYQELEDIIKLIDKE
jgi:hypothetical protein